MFKKLVEWQQQFKNNLEKLNFKIRIFYKKNLIGTYRIEKYKNMCQILLREE